ncbi:cell division protein FtsL [Buchnera aphidicola (Muscaphis stroyani)]|uniref:Cell division protein FtsL n=1 Tax=Buchnera aphidicola (Muscaphis stroyani) TaxID=1241869 RepID=A0A4D6Y5B7_9GAMM|nr:cell division protein FtsL [Buchnera aphidicola]QCI24309.1 cell division protein FtsL [Buchnera aphidicola (Muscaphis stroyani)]
MKKQRYNLPKIIKNDFFEYSKIHLILLLSIILSANCIVITVYNTRLLISQNEKIKLQIKKKKSEWRNLIIEKYSISINSAIIKN